MTAAQEVVLIVEDESGVAELQCRRLQRAGHHVESVETAGEALTRIEQGGVELLLLDYRLSGDFSGLDFYEQLKAAGYDLPVIMVTGFSQEATAIKALRAGVRDFVSKSIAYLDYLPEAVSRVLKQVRTEKRLAESEDQLRQSQKMEALGALAGGVAHEFNNLLQAILGYGGYAMAALPSDSQPYQDLTQVVKAAKRASELTRQLLGFGRREQLQRAIVDPNELVADLVKMLRPLIGAHIDLQLKLDRRPSRVSVDPGLFQQLLMNLCVNARDAMPSGGQLLIKTETVQLQHEYCQRHPETKPGPCLVLTVADSGCGMSSEVKARIFEPFFTTKDVGRGTGLGLALVYGVVQQHGGTIQVDSELQQGTTFRIYLPMAEGAPADERLEGSGAFPRGSERILLAEDDAMVRLLTARILQSAGYDVLVAADGEQAVRLFQDNADDIALVLLDVVMPKLSGHDAYQLMKLLKPELRAVMCTGYDPTAREVEFVAESDLRLIQKPCSPEVLLRTVRETLDSEPCQVPAVTH